MGDCIYISEGYIESVGRSSNNRKDYKICMDQLKDKKKKTK